MLFYDSIAVSVYEREGFMHIEAIANGLGGQSVYLFWMACQRKLPATVSITADTGWENDCLWSNGRRTPMEDYFNEVLLPISGKYGIESFFVRSVDKDKNPLPSLRDATISQASFLLETGKNCLKIPLYGSQNGQLRQSCTQRWKITAMNQQLRRMGAKTARTAIGIHAGEFIRRAKGNPLGRDKDGWINYQSGKHQIKEINGEKVRVWIPEKWRTHYYPLVRMGLDREKVQSELESLKIPYLISTECDGCPHKDAARWQRTSPKVMEDLSEIERGFNEKFFFTNQRIPLIDAISNMNLEEEVDFGCENDVCGI